MLFYSCVLLFNGSVGSASPFVRCYEKYGVFFGCFFCEQLQKTLFVSRFSPFLRSLLERFNFQALPFIVVFFLGIISLLSVTCQVILYYHYFSLRPSGKCVIFFFILGHLRFFRVCTPLTLAFLFCFAFFFFLCVISLQYSSVPREVCLFLLKHERYYSGLRKFYTRLGEAPSFPPFQCCADNSSFSFETTYLVMYQGTLFTRGLLYFNSTFNSNFICLLQKVTEPFRLTSPLSVSLRCTRYSFFSVLYHKMTKSSSS